MYNYITFGTSVLTKELWVQPKNNWGRKPAGGIWACKYTPKEEYLSAWQEWCDAEYPERGGLGSAVKFNLKDGARVCIIDELADLDRLILLYADNTAPALSPVLDFEGMSLDYDVIELTANGQRNTRETYPNSLLGWDMECILILNFDVIIEQSSMDMVETRVVKSDKF